MLVDSCSSELICVLVYQYVIQYLVLSQYLSLSPFSVSLLLTFLPVLSQRTDGKVTKQKGNGRKGLVENNCSFRKTPWD